MILSARQLLRVFPGVKVVGATHVVPELGPINQGVKRGLAPNEVRKGRSRMQDLGFTGSRPAGFIAIGTRLLSTC